MPPEGQSSSLSDDKLILPQLKASQFLQQSPVMRRRRFLPETLIGNSCRCLEMSMATSVLEEEPCRCVGNREHGLVAKIGDCGVAPRELHLLCLLQYRMAGALDSIFRGLGQIMLRLKNGGLDYKSIIQNFNDIIDEIFCMLDSQIAEIACRYCKLKIGSGRTGE
jgi:hypothetical protein